MAFLKKAKDITLQIVFGINPEPVSFESDASSVDEQDSYGAPVEKVSPLGYQASSWTIVYLIIQGVIGTGIFVTPASVLKSLGSVGASYVFWIVGFIITLFQISVYIEYVTYFPKRSGAEVVYLEQAYNRPKFMMPVVYAATTVILSFATSSASAFASYIFSAAGHHPTPWQQRGLALAPLFLCFIIVSVNNKIAVRLNNFLGFVKVVFIVFIAITGLVVLGGHTKVGNTHDIFKDAWKGTTKDGNSISNAILKVVFSYSGSGYAFSVVAETVPKDTIRAYKKYVPLTMFLIFILYILVVTAYFAGVGSVKEIKHAGSLVSSIFFKKVFGKRAATALDVFVAISAFGHLLGVFIAHSRSLRECGRQGVLPFPRLWTSVKPWGTPIFPAFITLLINIIVLLAPPPGDAYNFVVDLGSYSSYIFNMLLFVGLFKLRRHRKKLGLGYKEFHIWTPVLIVAILWTWFVLAMAFVPPKGTLKGSDVTFFYATYPLTTIGLFLICVFYYLVWAFILPKFGKYVHRIELFELGTGEQGHTVVKVPLENLAQYDAENGGQVVDSLNQPPLYEDITQNDTDSSGNTKPAKKDPVVVVENKF
ncbi:hypothetical protein JCM33374_g4830 [Metschnikowia sp. JCM 33374]|nr:hypothetical protein JCM33374_g4830 [Metschnikowia sp. JCM 33374]